MFEETKKNFYVVTVRINGEDKKAARRKKVSDCARGN